MSQDPPRWVRRYMKIPYIERDCWQLCSYIREQELGKPLPEWRDDFERAPDETLWSERIRDAVGSVVEREKERGEAWQPIERPEPFDLALYKVRKRWHVALVAGNGWAINTNLDRGSHLIRLRACEWTHLLDGYYRPA